MSLPISIHKLTAETGLTSRTLRHWESEGLFRSSRDEISGWRTYDETAVECIRITAFLRKMDLSIRDIKSILEERTFDALEKVLQKEIAGIEWESSALRKRRQTILALLEVIASKQGQTLKLSELKPLEEQIRTIPQTPKITEEISMSTKQPAPAEVLFVTLPSMRLVYHTAIGTAPEDDAMAPIIAWLETAGLMGTARLFGSNVDPIPSSSRSEYGYCMSASIPEGIQIPGPLKEMRIPGGLYAMFPSSDDIYGSWQILMKYLSAHPEYTPDHSRLCLEEHIRNDRPEGTVNPYHLILLEPVKKR